MSERYDTLSIAMQIANDRVPLPEKYRISVRKKFGSEDIPYDSGDLQLKHRSVKSFVEFIGEEERKEEEACSEDNRQRLFRCRGHVMLADKMDTAVDKTISRMSGGSHQELRQKVRIRPLKKSSEGASS